MPVLVPDSLAAACALLVEDRERIVLAGGTDLLVAWPQRFDRHGATYVDVSKLTELRTISFAGDALVLGAAATWWDAIRDDRVKRAAPLLPRVAGQVGALQIQTRGTWAGNIANASPAADGAAVLMAHDAILELISSDGEEEVPLAEFYLGHQRTRCRAHQLIRAIRVPLRERDIEVFEKVGARAAQTVSNLSLTVVHSAAGWRVVVGGMAPSVVRCPSLERLIESETPIDLPEALHPAIRADLSPIDDLRASAAYRLRVLARVAFTKLSEVCPWVQGRL